VMGKKANLPILLKIKPLKPQGSVDTFDP